jgi:hypothetical protein
MAELRDFLGSLISSISDARVQSDNQSIRIAETYAKDNLLQHFAIPRMRIEGVELNIPVAIDTVSHKQQEKFDPIDTGNLSSDVYRQILEAIEVEKLPLDVSKKIKSSIAEYIQLLEAQIKVNQLEHAFENFAKNIALKVLEQKDIIFRNSKRKADSQFFTDLQSNIVQRLLKLLNEIKLTPGNTNLNSVQFIVESAKLREIKPEYLLTIKMKITEEGMEWAKIENKDGKIISKLMPE